MGFQMKCVPVVEKMVCCCCSCTLKTATIVLASLYVLGNIMQFISSTMKLSMFTGPDPHNPYETKEAFIGGIAGSVIGLLISGLLLYGAYKEKPVFMLPYVILNLIGIIVGIVAILIVGIIITVGYPLFGIIFLVVGELILALLAYFWVVIYSYYRQLEESRYPVPGAPLQNFPAEPKAYYEFPHQQPGHERA